MQTEVLLLRDFGLKGFSKNTAFRHNYGFFVQRVTKIMTCTTYLIARR